MKYWNYKIKHNIESFDDLNLLKEKISINDYENIYNMLEWSLSYHDEKMNLFKALPIFNFIFNIKKFDNQVKNNIKSWSRENPYVLDWLLQNWNQIIEDLDFHFTSKKLINLLISITKTINYDFKFDSRNIKTENLSDQWDIRFLSNSELFNFIDDSKGDNGRVSIIYLFNKDSTLESIANKRVSQVTRERIRQIFNKEVKENKIFFNKIYDFIKKNVLSIDELNKTAIKIIEKILFPTIEECDSLLNSNAKFQNQVIFNFKNNPESLLDLEIDSEEIEILIKNNCIIFYNGGIHKIAEEYWGNKKLKFKDILEIFLDINYKDTQILNIEELRSKFYEFLLENNRSNNSYSFWNSRAFDGLIVRTKKLLYFDRNKVIVSLDKEGKNKKTANVILNEFINLKKQGIIMASTGKFLELFNNLTNYKFLDINPDAIHNFLKKYSTIQNKEIFFSRTPILINAEKTNVLDIFYKQVQNLFVDTKAINWNIFLDILNDECAFSKTLIQNYISDGYKYFAKSNNNVILLH